MNDVTCALCGGTSRLWFVIGGKPYCGMAPSGSTDPACRYIVQYQDQSATADLNDWEVFRAFLDGWHPGSPANQGRVV